MTKIGHDLNAVADRIMAALPEDRRMVVGVAGPPASGKSTFAEALADRLNTLSPGAAAVVPMDGFHLDNDTLDERGLRHVKGAPETFDAASFAALIGRLGEIGHAIRYPLFDRAADATVPDAGELGADTKIAVVEGNYLLLQRGEWARLAPLFDLTIKLAPPLEVLEARLIERWLTYGHTREQAEARARGNDLVNARTVLEESGAADVTIG